MRTICSLPWVRQGLAVQVSGADPEGPASSPRPDGQTRPQPTTSAAGWPAAPWSANIPRQDDGPEVIREGWARIINDAARRGGTEPALAATYDRVVGEGMEDRPAWVEFERFKAAITGPPPSADEVSV